MIVVISGQLQIEEEKKAMLTSMIAVATTAVVVVIERVCLMSGFCSTVCCC